MRAHLPACAAVASFVALGCGPLATFRPPSAFAGDRSLEMGLGSVAVSPRRYVDESWLHAGQFWVSGRATRWLNLSAIAAFDPEALGIGGGATVLLVRGDRFFGGFEGELGYGWGAAGIPISLRLFEENWVYASPRVYNFGIYPAFGVPVGLSLHLHEGAFARIEYQTSWVQLQPYNQRNHVGAALAVQW
jgi:hypothetical protein